MSVATLISSILLVVSVPFAVQAFARNRVDKAIQESLAEFQFIADAYTKHGSPEELAEFLQHLEDIISQFQFLNKSLSTQD